MNDADIEEAAAILLGHWRGSTKLDGLPERLRPADRGEGYRIALAVARLSGDPVAGWKVAATSEAGQRHIHVDGPLAGPILASRLVESGGKVPVGGILMRVAEAEFAFGFGRDLPEREEPYGRDEVMDAVASLHLSIEIPDSRFADFTTVGAPQLIADTACACWLVLGPPVVADWRGIDLAAQRVTAYRNGVEAGSGSGSAVLGDPRIALTWLVNEVARYGGGIRAGDRVTTGTCLAPVAIDPGDRIEADYGALGRIAAEIV